MENFTPLSAITGGALIGISVTVLLLFNGRICGVSDIMSGGCSSGHGICGIATLSIRSVIATLAFVATGMMTVYIIRHILELTA